MKLKDYREKRMRDPEVQAAYLKLRPKLELGRQILDARLERGWTQKELAERAGTKQANISRLENALINPSVDMLQRLANALGARLEIHLVPEEEASLADQPITEHATISIFAAGRPCAKFTVHEARTMALDALSRTHTTERAISDEAKMIWVSSTDDSAGSHEEEPFLVYNYFLGVEKSSTVHAPRKHTV